MRQLVPHFILEKYQARELRGSLPSAGIFVDLSGFSTMTDVLARHEQLGAETLTQVMRGVFEPLVEAVYAQGGFVVGYAGDAFQAIFIEDPARGPAVLRGLAAVVAIQDHAHAHSQVSTPFGTFPISLKAGLGFGEVSWLLLDSADGSQATYCVRGTSVDNSVAAEEHSGPGEIILDAASYAALADLLEAVPFDDGFQRVERIHGELPAPLPHTEPAAASDILSLFYPTSVVQQPIVGEFRPVVNVFVDIPIDPTDEAFVTPFMESVFKLQKRYDGFFLRPELGDKGFNILLFWGAPTVHENNVDRALNFLLDLYDLTGIKFRAGVSYRQAYAGFMGASMREDYTAYGWGVNLAARMMGASNDGEVWMEEEVARRAEKHFNLYPLGEHSFKGFSHKIKTFALAGRKQVTENIYRGEMVGREAELARWHEFVQPLERGEFAGVMVIRGEAGIGKSRLVYEFEHASGAESLHWVFGQTDEILRQSFNPFKAWLRSLFNFSEDLPDEANWRAFDDRFRAIIEEVPDSEIATELIRTHTVLAALLNLDQPGSFYDRLDAKGRYENTFTALATLIHAECLKHPMVLFLEDLHWLDEDTRAFLPFLVRSVLAHSERPYPLAIVGTTRPEGGFPNFDHPELIHEIGLTRLPTPSLSRLAEGILEGPVSLSLTSLLERRSEGNPFFAEQILRYLSENDLLLRLEDGSYSATPRAEMSIPTDVNAVLIARLDSLTREVREVVQTASILGREFELRLLAEMLNGDPKFNAEIKSAEQSDIWFALNELAYIFRHALLWDAAYSMQLETRRRNLHALAVEALEGIHAQDLDEYYGELAYHSEKASINEKALHYLQLAGKAAADAYQNAEALDYYRRALALLPSNDLRARFDLLVEHVSLFNRIGDRSSQLATLDSLKQIADDLNDNGRRAHYWALRAHYHITVSEFNETVYAARQTLDLASGEPGMALSSHKLWSSALLRLGNLDEAMRHAHSTLSLAEKSGSLLEQGNALTLMGLIALEMRDATPARQYLEQAVAIAREIQDRSLEAKALNNLANLAATIEGDLISARDFYERNYRIGCEQGDRYMQEIAVTNLGWVNGMLGDLEAAREYHTQSLTIARESGNIYTEEYTLINLGAVAAMQGDAPLAKEYATHGLELSRHINDRVAEAWALFYVGQAEFLAGNFEQAVVAYDQCIIIRTEIGLASLVMEARAGLVEVALERNDLQTAHHQTEIILQFLAEKGGFEGVEEPLRIYLACHRTLVRLDDPRRQAILRAAIQTLKEQTDRIKDEKTRRRFVENVPWRRAIWQTES
jgi:class 3 adenylate cyclase/tetratricopeptide (TPR) repeat protein